MADTNLTRRRFLQHSTLAALSLPAHHLFAQSSSTQNTTQDTTLHTPSGTLRGLTSSGVRIFRGVPFAQPPIGPLRFRPPVKATPHPGILDATTFAPAPMQHDPNLPHQSEDCLYLNIWTPASATPAAKLPVFVWIHGGGFTGGASFAPIFDGLQFAQSGIIVVTVAYRLGVFGFLDLEPLLGPAYSGSANNGLRDLICSLQWVRDNIAAFGGDPTRVTLGGESAGAKLTDILMGVPSATGLFSQMISESGGAERIQTSADAKSVALGFAKVVHETSIANTPITSAPAVDLIAAQETFIESWPLHFPLRPEIDGTLVPRLPIQTIASGSTRGKRLLIGTNRDESAAFLGPHPLHDPTAANLGNIPLARFNQVFAHYKQIYPDMSPEQLRIRAVTAEEYWIPSLRVAEAHIMDGRPSGGSVWMYRLDISPATGRMQSEAYHAEDLGFVWDKLGKDFADTPSASTLATEMHAAWVAFLEGETPSAPGLPTWPRYFAARETMIFNAVSKVEDHPQEKEMHLWDGVL
jgi:para-nitrobenzyl esterase